MLNDFAIPLRKRILVPAALSWPGQIQYLEAGELVAKIPHEPAPPGKVAVMTMAGPMLIPTDAIGDSK